MIYITLGPQTHAYDVQTRNVDVFSRKAVCGFQATHPALAIHAGFSTVVEFASTPTPCAKCAKELARK